MLGVHMMIFMSMFGLLQIGQSVHKCQANIYCYTALSLRPGLVVREPDFIYAKSLHPT